MIYPPLLLKEVGGAGFEGDSGRDRPSTRSCRSGRGKVPAPANDRISLHRRSALQNMLIKLPSRFSREDASAAHNGDTELERDVVKPHANLPCCFHRSVAVVPQPPRPVTDESSSRSREELTTRDLCHWGIRI